MDILEQIRRIVNPPKIKWHQIAWKNGKRVFISEKNLRKISVDEICRDKNLEPVRNRNFVPKSKPLNLFPDSMYFELLIWILKFLFGIR